MSTLKAPRKKMHLKMSSAEVVCCKKMPNITHELSIEANSVDPEQTALIGAVWSGSTVCHRRFLNISADKKKQKTFIAIGALRVKYKQILLTWQKLLFTDENKTKLCSGPVSPMHIFNV